MTWSDPPAYQRVTIHCEDLATGSMVVYEFPRVECATLDVMREDGALIGVPELIKFKFRGRAILDYESYHFMKVTHLDPPEKPIPGVW